MKTQNKFITLGLLSLFMLNACGGGSSGEAGSSTGSGTLSLNITDAPIDSAQNVFVSFTGVSIKPQEGPAFDIDFVDNNGDPEVKTIDLLDQQGPNSAPILVNHTLDAGHYNWIRLKVLSDENTNDSYIVLDSGAHHNLYVPSGDQTGLKLNNGFEVTDGGAVTFTIDFDLRKSVVAPGNNSLAYKLKPSLRMVSNNNVGHISGEIGSVSLNDADCTDNDYAVYVYSGTGATPDDVDGDAGDPVATALVSVNNAAEYEYAVGFLEQGNYTITFTCQAGDDISDSDDAIEFIGTDNVTVTAGSTTIYNFN
ncbi:MAG: DUF4382 domain-containing protein [Gammaproteobacteria bacterium]|nr:DUF4382 domain-containing protein [Gammaproteobacteria bacterium]